MPHETSDDTYTFSDLEHGRRILSRLGISSEAFPRRAEWVAEEVAKVREEAQDAAMVDRSLKEVLLADSDAVIAQVVAMNGGQVPFGLNAPAVLRALSRHANLEKKIAEAKAEADAWGDPT